MAAISLAAFLALAAASDTQLDVAALASGCGAEASETLRAECVLGKWFEVDSGRAYGSREVIGNAGTYGEIEPAGVFDLIKFIAEVEAIGPDDVFVDLGSGRGRIPLQMVLTTPARASGVELDPSRHAEAEIAADRLAAASLEAAMRLNFVQGDIRSPVHSADATLTFMNSVCFPASLMLDVVASLAKSLAPGAIVLTTRRLQGCHRGFRFVGETLAAASWSQHGAKVFMYMVAPQIPSGIPLWLDHVDLNSGVHNKVPSIGNSDLKLLDCSRNVSETWHSRAPSATRLCHYATCGRRCDSGVVLDFIDFDLWMRAWVQGGLPAIGTAPKSLVECAWRELDAQQRAEAEDPTGQSGRAVTFVSAFSDLGTRSDSGATIFHHGAAAQNPDALDMLFDGLSTPSAVRFLRIVDDKGQSPLHAALDDVSVEVLLRARADVAIRDARQRTALQSAAQRGAGSTAIAALVAAGAEVSAVDDNGQTALHLAAPARGQPDSVVETVASLIDAGVPLAEVDGLGLTALHVARTARVAELLLAAGADPTAFDNQGMMPEAFAASVDRTDVVKVLKGTGGRGSDAKGSREL